MAEEPTCAVCDGVILPDEAPEKDIEGRPIHRDCGGTVGGRAAHTGLDWSPARRAGPAAQGGLPSLGKRRP
jgi:hypothetical protein